MLESYCKGELVSLKNYSTKIPAAQTVNEIEYILQHHNATDIWKQYENGNIISLNFAVNTEFGKIPFKLPVNVEAVVKLLKDSKKEKKINLSVNQVQDIEVARRIAWRIIKDWIDAQMALVDISMVKLEQVFLPYAYDFNKNQSLYDSIKERKYAGMLMEGNHDRRT